MMEFVGLNELQERAWAVKRAVDDLLSGPLTDPVIKEFTIPCHMKTTKALMAQAVAEAETRLRETEGYGPLLRLRDCAGRAWDAPNDDANVRQLSRIIGVLKAFVACNEHRFYMDCPFDAELITRAESLLDFLTGGRLK